MQTGANILTLPTNYIVNTYVQNLDLGIDESSNAIFNSMNF